MIEANYDRNPWGPSPRVRGKQLLGLGSQLALGSIPARAGETPFIPLSWQEFMVHPRACGGNHYERGRPNGEVGPSPRVRGKPGDDVESHRD